MTLTKSGAGNQILAGENTYSGATTLTAGTLTLGANDVLPDATDLIIGNATLDAATFTDALATLDVTSTAKINLGTGATLTFSNSSAINWTGGSLNLTGILVSGSSLRFGTNSSGLAPAQLALISASGFNSFALDSNGYLIATPLASYANWKTTHAPTGTPGGDFDGDGVTNGIEYVLGGTASTRDLGKLPTISTTGPDLLFSFIRDQATIDGITTVLIEVGSTLSTWPVNYPVPTTAAADNPGVTVFKDFPSVGYDTVTLTLPHPLEENQFIRLKVVP